MVEISFLLIFTLILLVIFIFFNQSKNSRFIYENTEKKWKYYNGCESSLISRYSYQSYNGDYYIVSKNTFYPKTLTDIKKIVKRNIGRKIRVVGGRHTFNDISISKDITIRTDRLNHIINFDKTKKEITVESGVAIGDICVYLEKYKLALPNIPSIPFHSIGGAVSMGSHGSNINWGSLCSIIKQLTVVLSDGSIKKIINNDKNYKVFRALNKGLGCLGIIYSITLQCVDMYYIKHSAQIMSLDTFIKNIKSLKKEYQYLQAYIWPNSKKNTTVVYLRKKVSPNKKIVSDKYIIGPYHEILTKNIEIGSYTEMEIAISTNHFEKVVNDTVKYCEENQKKSNPYPILIRFCQNDDSLLDGNSKMENVHISIFSNDKEDNFFKPYEDLMIMKFKGKPHFGKKNYLDGNKMKNIYGNKVSEFIKIKNRLDPTGMFSNEYIDRIII